ncbi:uncharacterized protein LOC129593335 [Paramacrobiotus metropolitanus]|uniref:uncharacterized protein LOC129593335 n=1 Tax=Paramacrobiotus metropolitanus TaxID=2943436 RepID=UPI00244560FC|nr:uncharacterized protein LOC129593335 [Paramacrobiotus metropolitanus]
MQIILVTLLLVACASANVIRERRQLPSLTGGSAGCTADQKAQCGSVQCQNNGNSNTQVISGGNSGGGGLASLIPLNLLNGAGVQAPINANVCPPVSVCNTCLAVNILG